MFSTNLNLYQIFCLYLFPCIFLGSISAQAPLLVDSNASIDLEDESKLEWRIKSAELALDAGLPGLAETIYSTLLDSRSVLSARRLDYVQIGLAKSLICQSRYEAARVLLEAMSTESRGSQHALYLALSIYGQGREPIDKSALRIALEHASEEDLQMEDLPWLALIQGLEAQMYGNVDVATAAFNRAFKNAGSSLLRDHFEAILLRQKIVSAPADESLAVELHAKIVNLEGQSSAYPFLREYAVVLHSLGRTEEAITAINASLEGTSPGFSSLELEQLRLLKGIILGASSESGRAVLEELILSGRDLEVMGIALQLLASSPGQEAELLVFLEEAISLAQPHPLLGHLYYLRSQLALKDPATRSIAESDARILLEQFPGMSEVSNVYRLLAYAALEKEPRQYRTAADYLIRLRNQSTQTEELVEINRLIGDCYFLNRDYANAVDFYLAARSRETSVVRDGDLLLRLISALVRTGLIDDALQLIDEGDFNNNISSADRWRAEWNVAQALQINGQPDVALKRVRLLLQDAVPNTVPTALDLRLLWLESYLSLEANQIEGLADRVMRLLARLESMPLQSHDGVDVLNLDTRQTLKTEILLLQGSIHMREGDINSGMLVLNQLREEFASSDSAQRSYLIEASYHALVGDFLSAQATLTDLAQRYPQSSLAPQALFEAALYCERRGAEFYSDAVVLHNDLAERYASDPLFYTARLKQGNLLRLINDFAGAQIVYENLINSFPAHQMRYISELSRADCMLALAGNEPDDLGEAISVLERLLDLPNLPLDFQVEASYKWAFALSKRQSVKEAEEVLSLSITRFLIDEQKASELSATGRYWISRSMLKLGELLENDDSHSEASRIYRMMIAYNLPGRQIAIARADRLLSIE